ncbi:hypothetical protein [Pontimicrobium sp. IMCC45349]|uniref:hypothetical protein n=1 Tax=Pontimicrobium sp. IMCC45349 TaxID=3391574 RepID=UPI000C3B4596|nr:hypothetical protein [Flavobacteriaceae bacterium]MBD10496.1 hypothetical protein [Flavobacteriaceae bacterium]|tara:strand:+ start:11262 stop:11495 length:234 start_codon:yes stop_codon:yes gene_type:complete
MARKDDILKSFLEHEIISEKYGINKDDIPDKLQEGLNSEHAIIKAISLIVENTEGFNTVSDKALYSQITQFLNESAI